MVAVNPTFTDKTFSYTFDNPSGTYYMNSHSYGVSPTFSSSASQIFVPAHSYAIISNMADPSGVEDVITDKNTSISIYPNPATDYINVSTDEVNEINVYSLTGAIVARSTNSTTVDVSHLSTGNYIVRIVTPNGVSTSKLIKK